MKRADGDILYVLTEMLEGSGHELNLVFSFELLSSTTNNQSHFLGESPFGCWASGVGPLWERIFLSHILILCLLSPKNAPSLALPWFPPMRSSPCPCSPPAGTAEGYHGSFLEAWVVLFA